MKKASKKQPASPKKQVKHKKHTQQFMRVYWPYIPLFILVFFGLTFGYSWRSTNVPRFSASGVLAYATEMSAGGLLSSTNSQRSQNGLAALTLNSKLSNAAQSKANDMVARNYWSHTTPDGKEPWTFVEAAGYAYQKAGENLAYGFDTTGETVVGWMNSPSHRANILDTSYKEVGFGFANSASYVGTGEETVVVAMYGNPSSVAPVATSSTPATAPAVQQKTAPATTPAPTPAAQPTNQDTVVPTEQKTDESKDKSAQPVTSDTPTPAAQPTTRITKLQSITSGSAPWSAAALSGFVLFVVGFWVLKHAFAVKKVLIDGEKFILHHPLIDVGVLIIVAIAILLSQSSGLVK